jgi:hypothetical protein
MISVKHPFTASTEEKFGDCLLLLRAIVFFLLVGQRMISITFFGKQFCFAATELSFLLF